MKVYVKKPPGDSEPGQAFHKPSGGAGTNALVNHRLLEKFPDYVMETDLSGVQQRMHDDHRVGWISQWYTVHEVSLADAVAGRVPEPVPESERRWYTWLHHVSEGYRPGAELKGLYVTDDLAGLQARLVEVKSTCHVWEVECTGGTFVNAPVYGIPGSGFYTGIVKLIRELSLSEQTEEPVATKKSAKTENIEVVRSGKEIILPAGMTYDAAMDALKRRKTEEEREVNIMETVEAYPLDGAYAFHRAMAETYGWVDNVPTPGFFADRPPTMIGVEVAPGRTVQVPWGRVNIPNVTGYLDTGIYWNDKGLPCFQISGIVLQKHKAEIAELAALTRQFVREGSIYKGKAIRVELPEDGDNFDPLNDAPKFIDTSAVNPSDLIFPAETRSLVDYALFAPIEHTAACREHQIPLKRGVLLEGPYGVGKTMTALVTAKKCVEQNWTYIYVNKIEQLPQVIRFARAYQPAVVFAEDIDALVGTNRTSEVNGVLNTLDGVDTKDLEMILVLTTNHVENVHPALLRPGRLDAVVPVRPPDAEAVIRLVNLYARGLILTGEDLRPVGTLLTGQIPAVVREVVERAKLAAVASSTGGRLTLRCSDLETAARGMLAHLELIKPKAADNRSDVEKAADALGRHVLAGLAPKPLNGTSSLGGSAHLTART